MSVYFAIPSARPPEEAVPVLRKWQERGYRVVIQRDTVDEDSDHYSAQEDFHLAEVFHRKYAGYAESVNFLCREIIHNVADAEWIVVGGDDTLPDPNHSAEEIARECVNQLTVSMISKFIALYGPTFGVMQPTGDRWEVNGPGTGAGIDRVAGSPWIGRSFAERMYGGRGPLCEAYYHCGEDEELQAVATMMGVFWQRQDLTHMHSHWARPKTGERIAPATRMPAFLKRANSSEEWASYKKIFADRKANGFPGSEPIL